MAVPSRKNKMMQKIIYNQEMDKKKLEMKKDEDKKVDKEEHNKRLEMLKKMGLVKN